MYIVHCRVFTFHYIKISERQRLVVQDDLWNVSRNGYGILFLRDCLIFLRCFFIIFFLRTGRKETCVFFGIAGGSQFKNTFQNGIGFRIKKKKSYSTRRLRIAIIILYTSPNNIFNGTLPRLKNIVIKML